MINTDLDNGRSYLPDYPEGSVYPTVNMRAKPEGLNPTGILTSQKWETEHENNPFLLQPRVEALIGKAKGRLAKNIDKLTPGQRNVEERLLNDMHGIINLDYDDILIYINSNPKIVTSIRSAFILQNKRMGRSNPNENIDNLNINNYILYLVELLLDPQGPDYTFENYTEQDVRHKLDALLQGHNVYGGKKYHKTLKYKKNRVIKKVKKSRKNKRSTSKRFKKSKKGRKSRK